MALRWGEWTTALDGVGLLTVGLGFGEGACVEGWLAIRHDSRTFRFGGDRRRHLDWLVCRLDR